MVASLLGVIVGWKLELLLKVVEVVKVDLVRVLLILWFLFLLLMLQRNLFNMLKLDRLHEGRVHRLGDLVRA